jgi:hypothetical protein
MRAISAVLGAALVLTAGNSALAQSAGSGSLKAGPQAYHVTYTLTQMDGAKRIGVQRYTMSVTADNEEAHMKLGSRVPVETGTGNNSQFQYIDIGLDIRATLHEFSNGLELYSEVEESGVASASNTLLHVPVIRHTDLTDSTLLTVGKPITLGSLDQPGSTEHLNVEVSIEPIR